ncbi:single-stranded-DNA-specific exonuclease RecJ [Taibaiella sp. KBW10]|uniref:single-stranded-DNA-specific exonuclease RecJ n=1 Tax=Taibaiella sp. KBW10 TaxID=2153357 RepID=UPI000F5B8769|nr:single-stranded-DNA-specific exonuclease RecJ [Taibaiella sp. KBW10]RQO30183.1 single-stranded-DNA-specific exonuclease RecJ [Taibaiella sp. KBW10]
MRLEKRWTFKPRNEPVIAQIQKDLNISASLCSLLEQRGIKDYNSAKAFFRPELTQLHDPFLMKGMREAVSYIDEVLQKDTKIMVFGDYDVDGTTAVAVVYDFLNHHAPKVSENQLCYYIPHRYNEGYGLSIKAIDHCIAQHIELIITLDCGIKSVEKIAYAKANGITVIVCDHHLPETGNLPEALAILNPKQEDCPYPFKELSGCGIGFKLISGLAEHWNLDTALVYNYLDLVATSIAADIVPIYGENRILAYFGVQKVNENPCLAIQVIRELVDTKKVLKVSDLVFVIAPRINAAGRMDDGNKAVALFIERDHVQAQKMAAQLHEDNSDRRVVDKSISDEALMILEEDGAYKNYFSTVLFRPHWHKGVVGIVASRLVDHYYKPTIVLTESNNKITGSARSVTGFNIHDAIASCSDLLENFGGHYFAAGLTMAKENFEPFRQRFEDVVKNTISTDSQSPEIIVDTEIDLSCINYKFYNILQQFEPFGPDNMRPVFCSRGVKNYRQSCRVVKDQHIKFTLCQQGSAPISGIGFNLAYKFDLITQNDLFDIVYTVEENEWNNETSLQLKILDIRASA